MNGDTVHRLERDEEAGTWRLLSAPSGEIRESSDPLLLVGWLLLDVQAGQYGDDEWILPALQEDAAKAALLFGAAMRANSVGRLPVQRIGS